MRAECAELVRIGGCEERFAELSRDSARRAVEIEPAFVEMTDLDCVEAVDVRDQPLTTDRSANDEERMRREGENGIAACRSQAPHVIEIAERLCFFGSDV